MSSSKLQRYVSQQLSIHLGQYTIRENIRPGWLNTDNGGNLELDFFIEGLGLAIEVQGRQHWIFVPFFHGDSDGYNRRIENDRIKRDRCRGRDIKLVEIFHKDEIDALIRELTFSDYKPGELEAELEYFERRGKEARKKAQEETDNLERELRKTNKGIDKIRQRIVAKDSSTELENNKRKLAYVIGRKNNILQRLNEIGS